MLLLIGAAFEFELFVRIMSTWLELFKLKKKRIKPDYVSKSLQAFEISFEKLKLHQASDNFPPSCFNIIFCYVKNILSLSSKIHFVLPEVQKRVSGTERLNDLRINIYIIEEG